MLDESAYRLYRQLDRAKMLKIFFAMLFFLFAAAVLAQENMGVTLASRGDVRISREGAEHPLKQGDFIAVGDRVITAERSFCVITLYDGAKLSLRPNSTIEVVEFSAEDDHALLELKKGGIKLVAGSIVSSNPNGFKIRTPISTLSVRDQEASVRLCDGDVCEHSGVE